jgi:primary-amine oxidase
MEELQAVEFVCRKDPGVIEQCKISGIPEEDMHKVYCDPWTIGFDERHGSKVRLQQALMYYRPNVDDCQYQYPLDFCPIYDSDKQAIIAIDIPKVRRPLSTATAINYTPSYVNEKEGGYRNDLKPINITQPDGVSFKVTGREIEWQRWKMHIGFNYREGIVLNNITYDDKGTVRPIFYRLSLAEMVVPYGNPEHPHQRKHAFDLGEYGGGYMTNSLALGCDCKGSIHYLDAHFPTRAGGIRTIKNAICIHEEDDGILFKHSDFRDDSMIVTRARKLIIQQIFTAANYEYAIQWVFHQDGTIQPEIKLTGILNTYALNADEDPSPWGTQVYPGVNAHNHQHLFCLRIDPNVDGPNNTVFMADTVPSDAPVGSAENYYGNAFYAKRTKLATTGQSRTDYSGATSRTWDICNEGKLHPYSKKPASYKLVSREVPGLLPKEGSLVWKRAGFARHAVHVTKCEQSSSLPQSNRPVRDRCKADIKIPPNRLGRPALARGPPRPADLRRALARPAGVDRRRQRVHREHGYCPLAHFWRDPYPRSGGFPRHAGRADDPFTAPAQLFQQQPRHERPSELRLYPEPDRGQEGGSSRRCG